MKTLIALLVCGLAIDASTQSSMKSFTSSDSLFHLQYSDMLVDCAPRQAPASALDSGASEEAQPSTSISPACVSQGANCDGPGSEGMALACFAYPKEKFKNNPSFVAASFYISKILSAKTEKVCLAGSPDWYVLNSKAGVTVINHTAFTTFEIGDNWAGGGQSGPAYRTFHSGKCYELGIQTVLSRAAYDPEAGSVFTDKDRSEVEGRLREALDSFVFLK